MNGRPRLQRRRLGAARDSISAHARLRLYHRELHGNRQIHADDFLVVEENCDFHFFFEKDPGLSKLFLCHSKLLVGLDVHEDMVVSLPIEKLRPPLLEGSGGKLLVGAKGPVDQRPASQVP